MSIDKIKKEFNVDFNDLEHFKFPLDEFCSLTVNYKKIKYEFLFRFSSQNKNLVCLGSGAYQNRYGPPPFYNRHSWESEFNSSVIYYNDPIIYDFLENPKLDGEWVLGWGVGNEKDWYLYEIGKIIEKLKINHNIKNKNTIFFGSSGGGFTSLIFSTIFKKSSAIINNPQIFCKVRMRYINMILETCFNDMSLEEFEEVYGYRIDIIKMIQREKYIPNTKFLINIYGETEHDRADFETHYIPFLRQLRELDYFNNNKVDSLFYLNKKGHPGVYDKNKTLNIINNHLKDFNKEKRKMADMLSIKGYLKYKIGNIKDRIVKKV
ncbi:MAG: hypothetical protein ACRC1M_04190 [Methanobacteriaceae archaeon]